MSEHRRETAFLRRLILYEDTAERCALDAKIDQAQRNEHCVQRVAVVTLLFSALAAAGLVFGSILQENFPDVQSRLLVKVVCVLGLTSLICLVAFAVLLMNYRGKLNRLREECRQLVAKLLESRLGAPCSVRTRGGPQGNDGRAGTRSAADRSAAPAAASADSAMSS